MDRLKADVFRRTLTNNVNPEAYLRDTLAKIAEGHPISRIDALMPWTSNGQGQ